MAYRIRTVSELTGVPRNTLIAWERRYGFVRPRRNDNGYRSYSEEDVANLLRIRNALGAGLKISEAIALLKKTDQNGAVPIPTLAQSSTFVPADKNRHRELCDSLTSALIEYRARDAERLLSQLVTVPFEERVHAVFFPVLQRIGELWSNGEVNIAQEHYASAIIRDQLVSILVGVGTKSAQDPHAVCTTFPGELHEIAAMALGVHLGLRGYRVSYLGANLPLPDLLDFCVKQKPSLVCISVIAGFPRTDLQDYATALRAQAPPSARLVLGGSGVRTTPLPEVAGVEFIPNWHDFSA